MAFGFNLAAIDDHLDHLTAYWHMEETGASNRVDDVGSNDAVPTNAPSTRTGKDNNALDLNGTSQYLTVTDHADISPTTGMAFSIWLYGDSGVMAASRAMFIKTSCYLLAVSPSSGGFFYSSINQSDTTLKQVTGPIPFEAAEEAWHNFVCMACDGFVRMYIDNVEVATPVAYDNTIIDNGNDLIIGANAVPGAYWDGGMDGIPFFKNISFARQETREAFVDGFWNDGNGRFYAEIPAAVVNPIQPHNRFRKTGGEL